MDSPSSRKSVETQDGRQRLCPSSWTVYLSPIKRWLRPIIKTPDRSLHRISLSTLESPNPTGNRFWRIGGHSLVVKNTGKELKHLSACNFFTYQLYSEKGASSEQPPHIAHQPPRKYVCTHGSFGKAFGRNFELANHVEYDHSDGRYMIEFKYKECQRNFA